MYDDDLKPVSQTQKDVRISEAQAASDETDKGARRIGHFPAWGALPTPARRQSSYDFGPPVYKKGRSNPDPRGSMLKVIHSQAPFISAQMKAPPQLVTNNSWRANKSVAAHSMNRPPVIAGHAGFGARTPEQLNVQRKFLKDSS